MSSWSYALTNKGRQLQAKAQAGVQLVYTRMAVGSGTLSGQSLEDMSALITPVKDLTISRLKRPPGSTRALIGATLTNQDVTTGFYLREVGIFATDPDLGEILYMYANAGSTADYITPKGDGVIEKAINMNVFVGAASSITANIDESLVYVTKDELNEAIAGITIPDASLTVKGKVQLSNATNSSSETLAATPKAVKSAYDAATAAQNTANAANLAAATAQSRADQAFQSGNERKAEVVAALVAKGIPATTAESWDSLIAKMAAIIRATGNAGPAQVLSGYTFSNASGNNQAGAMPKQASGARPASPDAGYADGVGNLFSKVPPGYYYEDNVYISSHDPDFVAGNLPKDTNIFGLVGALERMTTAEKQGIADAITGKGVPASVNDLNTVLAQKIGQIKLGSLYATGTATVSNTNTLEFTRHDGVVVPMKYLQVSGLNFLPKTLLVVGNDLSSGTGYGFETIYRDGMKFRYDSAAQLFISSAASGSMGVVLSGNAYLTSTGFLVPVNPYYTNRDFSATWYAFGD
ncbi:hypothetical protein FRY98_24530 [Paenibacillus faecis]|uniref:Phage tail fibre protein N-terminal domain-containing protein n=1 Tax=Paenibacillus faecis TaxID=862114 RepID=A0A5D0CLP6_9BACL|nr:tail fiber protein [Paenibacillus faecis]TYA10939.1 hypothetical protein FRY98_24530 [Paenibacillus faecis]